MAFGGSNRWNWLPIPLIAAFSMASLWGAEPPLSPESSTIPLSLDLATLHHLEVLEASEDAWSLRSTGSDPYVTLKPLPAATEGGQRVVLSFETFCPQGLDDLEIFFGPPITASQSMSVGPLIKAEAWMPVAIDLPFESDQSIELLDVSSDFTELKAVLGSSKSVVPFFITLRHYTHT
ncbi:MAG: hypothetical protein VXW84_06720, partial [Verrucomicrobiota bacterium]|nr:hypothetical protein [Verrucomicrobiota bacterium]